jgi:hypothetical protein
MADHDETDDDSAAAGEPPELDDRVVARIVGKRLLVGLTILEHTGALIEHKQLHGVVEQISRGAGIVMRLPDGTIYRLPPDLSGIQEAPPGIYRLRSTGEEVQDPDFLYTWTLTRPAPDAV